MINQGRNKWIDKLVHFINFDLETDFLNLFCCFIIIGSEEVKMLIVEEPSNQRLVDDKQKSC